MQTITWNKRRLDGSTEEVHFTRLFGKEGGVEERRIRIAVDVIARRQGIIRSEKQFNDELDRIILSYRLSCQAVRDDKEAGLAKEYFGTQAMLATVRYGLSHPDSTSLRAAMNRFKEFMKEAGTRNSYKEYAKAS